jgi:hypothetical protein
MTPPFAAARSVSTEKECTEACGEMIDECKGSELLEVCCAEAREEKKEKCETGCGVEAEYGKDAEGAEKASEKRVCEFTVVKNEPVEEEEEEAKEVKEPFIHPFM